MIRRRSLAFLGLTAFALSLAGCQREDAAAPAADTPTAAVEALAGSLRDNDLARFSRASVPPAMYARLETRWKEEQAAQPEPSDEERKQFDELLARFTAPDASEKLYAELEPSLDKFEAEMAAQMPLMVAMGSGFLSASVQQNEALSEEQKKHAGEVIGELATWASGLKLGDRDKIRQALDVVAETARALELESIDQMRGFSFEQTLQRGGVVLAGGKRVLALYGLDADRMLDSMQAELVSEQGDQARVRVTYTLLEKPISFEVDMVRQEGGWYTRDAIASTEEQLAAPLSGEGDGAETELGVGPEAEAEAGSEDAATAGSTD